MKELTKELLFKINSNKFTINWVDICLNYKLSEEFIIKFEDQIRWDCISQTQKFSEDFIRKYKDQLHWYCISSKHEFSEDSVIEFQDYIFFVLLLENSYSNRNIYNYSKSTQNLIIKKIIGLINSHGRVLCGLHIAKYATHYMREQYERLSLFV